MSIIEMRVVRSWVSLNRPSPFFHASGLFTLVSLCFLRRISLCISWNGRGGVRACVYVCTVIVVYGRIGDREEEEDDDMEVLRPSGKNDRR